MQKILLFSLLFPFLTQTSFALKDVKYENLGAGIQCEMYPVYDEVGPFLEFDTYSVRSRSGLHDRGQLIVDHTSPFCECRQKRGFIRQVADVEVSYDGTGDHFFGETYTLEVPHLTYRFDFLKFQNHRPSSFDGKINFNFQGGKGTIKSESPCYYNQNIKRIKSFDCSDWPVPDCA